MSKYRKIVCLTLLLSVCLFPASAFASSNQLSSDDKKDFFSNILSFFTSSIYSYSHSESDDKHKDDDDWDSTGWFDWFDKKKSWWDTIRDWEYYNKDSFAIWKKYYCY
ncbi:hypothetical protein L1N85_04490 [Paenibacillus alkaliterrae]|uniref:hypothetical protein n=1 Tax=Paenibacillus alkaliterrae TaxID=320909 RepID=UPI001F492350|nr:hypothetical protein [Paenibacillus alkaliterrae]MCF2937692.1 hypothetical protein [Paenibacillus alkaliterrae]